MTRQSPPLTMRTTFQVESFCGVLLVLSLLATSCDEFPGGHESPVWSVAARDDLWTYLEMPTTLSESPVINSFYYDIDAELFYARTGIFASRRWLTTEDVATAPTRFYVVGTTLTVDAGLADASDRPGLVELNPGDGILLASSLLRSVGESLQNQPFGELTLRATIDEIGYEVERRGGFPFHGGDYVEQLGDGVVGLDLKGPRGESLFTLEERYEGNSGDYSAQFSPDGRFLLVNLPNAANSAAARLPGTHRFIIVGPLPVGQDKARIRTAIRHERDQVAVREALDRRQQQYRDGRTTAEDYFGEVYVSARDKVLGCADIERRIGTIESLDVQDRVLDFGNPESVGKVFTFDYVASNGSGSLQVISLEPVHQQAWQSQYKPYLDSVDLRTGTGVQYANCPEGLKP